MYARRLGVWIVAYPREWSENVGKDGPCGRRAGGGIVRPSAGGAGFLRTAGIVHSRRGIGGVGGAVPLRDGQDSACPRSGGSRAGGVADRAGARLAAGRRRRATRVAPRNPPERDPSAGEDAGAESAGPGAICDACRAEATGCAGIGEERRAGWPRVWLGARASSGGRVPVRVPAFSHALVPFGPRCGEDTRRMLARCRQGSLPWPTAAGMRARMQLWGPASPLKRLARPLQSDLATRATSVRGTQGRRRGASQGNQGKGVTR